MSVLPVQSEKVQLTLQAGDVWQNGLLMNADKAVFATSSPVNYSNGIQRTATGAIFCVDATAGMPAGFTWTNGLPFSPLGALCISSGPVATWSNGIPFTASGAVAASFLPPAALDLNLTSGTLDSRVTFTRASGGTRFNSSGVLETVASDVPRFDHDPVTLAPRGLLIEGARTNLVQFSEEMDNAYWTKAQSSVTANATAAPSGATTADNWIPTTSGTTGQTRLLRQVNSATTVGQAVTVSAYVNSTAING